MFTSLFYHLMTPPSLSLFTTCMHAQIYMLLLQTANICGRTLEWKAEITYALKNELLKGTLPSRKDLINHAKITKKGQSQCPPDPFKAPINMVQSQARLHLCASILPCSGYM
jgi:hypothetical protein